MDLETRIRRRIRDGEEPRLVLSYDALNPVAHLEEPAGRGPVLERLLDHVDPLFRGALPENAYVWGPSGAGKSAVVSALFANLAALPTGGQSVIHTTTRAQPTTTPTVAYVDARATKSEFGLVHAILDAVSPESVPRHGVSTDDLRERLSERLAEAGNRVLVAVDHVGEPETYDLETVASVLDPFAGSLSWIAVGRDPPLSIPDGVRPPATIEVPPYQRQVLVDILMTRTSEALTRQVLEHDQARRVAAWSDGNAHDALAALFGAADLATADGAGQIREDDLVAGMDAVPHPSTSLGRVLALPDNRQTVLAELLRLDEADRASVTETTQAIADSPRVDLSSSTVKRFLYELAEAGIVERETLDADRSHGRPPSRVEPRFPTLVFRRLYEMRDE